MVRSKNKNNQKTKKNSSKTNKNIKKKDNKEEFPSPSIHWLHYYFSDFNSYAGNINQQINQAKRLTSLEYQLKEAKDRWNNTISVANQNVVDDFGNTLAVMFSDEALEMRQEAYEGASVSNDINMKIGEYTVGQLGAIGKGGSAGSGLQHILERANEIAEQIKEFIDELNKVIEQAYEILGRSETLNEYKAAVIDRYLAYSGHDESFRTDNSQKYAREIIDSVLTHNGLYGFHKSNKNKEDHQGPLETSLQNLILLADSLPEFNFNEQSGLTYTTGSSKKQPRNINSEAEFLNILSMKTNGLLTNIKGGCGEVAVKVGELSAGQLVADATIEATVVGTGAAINTEKVTIDTNLEDLKNLQIAGTNSKGDVLVKISRDNVVIVYTVTVKEGKEHEITRKLGDNSYLQQVLTAKLVDETPFLAAARKIYPDRYIWNVGAGHGSGNRNDIEKGERITEAQITEQWEELKKTTITNNLTFFLTGLKEENVLYMVANKKIYQLADIIESVIDDLNNYSSNGRGNLLSWNISNTSRSTMLDFNKWIPKEDGEEKYFFEKAQERSDKAIPKINDYLSKAKILVKLNLLVSQ